MRERRPDHPRAIVAGGVFYLAKGQATFALKVALPFGQGSGYLCPKGPATVRQKVR